MNLDALSLSELKQLQADVATAIKDFESRRRAEALAELKALAASKGFSLEELTGGRRGRQNAAPPRLNLRTLTPRRIPGLGAAASRAGCPRRLTPASHSRTSQSRAAPRTHHTGVTLHRGATPGTTQYVRNLGRAATRARLKRPHRLALGAHHQRGASNIAI